MSNESNSPAQEPHSDPWGHGGAEIPRQGGAQDQPPHQPDPNATVAWAAEPGSPAPTTWPAQAPVSSQPAQPMSGQPVSGQPAQPMSGQPAYYGPPQAEQYSQPQVAHYATPQQDWTSYQPVSAQPGPSPQSGAGPASWTAPASPAAEPAGQWPRQQATGDDMGMAPSWRPRIEPTAPSPSRFLPGLLVGLLAGLMILAPAGYFVGDLMFGDDGKPSADATGSPSPVSTALPPYEAAQAELNRVKFNGDLAALAEPWLPYMSRCVNSSDPYAPRPPRNEVTRVTCELGDMTIFFVEFQTPGDRDQEFVTRKEQNTNALQLAPGAATPTRQAGLPGINGNYVEYAFKPAKANSKTFAGIWWDRDGAPLVAARIEAAWGAEGLHESWEPLRNIWQRHG